MVLRGRDVLTVSYSTDSKYRTESPCRVLSVIIKTVSTLREDLAEYCLTTVCYIKDRKYPAGSLCRVLYTKTGSTLQKS